MKVLLVAPRIDLASADAEVQSVIGSGLDVTPLLGTVTVSEVVATILDGNYDVLWFATHGGKDGIQLSDGILRTRTLVRLVIGRFSIVFLNTCSNIEIAQMIQNEGACDVVATIRDIPDDDAYLTGALFAESLARGNDARTAYDDSRLPENKDYVFLAGKKKMSNTERQTSENYSAYRPSVTDYQRLYSAVFGDGFNWDGILEQLKEIKREVSQLNNDVVELSGSVQELVKDVVALRGEVSAIKERTGGRESIGQQTQALLWAMTIGLGFLILITLWPLLSKLLA